jgi:hypothetical protein
MSQNWGELVVPGTTFTLLLLSYIIIWLMYLGKQLLGFYCTNQRFRNCFISRAPSLLLAPDWDIANEIEIACKQLQIQHPPTIQHIKGHQDRENSSMNWISSLSLMSALRIVQPASSREISAQYAPSCTVCPTMSPSFQLQIQATNKVCRFSPSTAGTYEEQV